MLTGSDTADPVVRFRAIVLATWLAAAALLLPASRRVEQSLDVAARVRGSESAAVEDALRTRFASPFGTWALLVVTGTPSLTTVTSCPISTSMLCSGSSPAQAASALSRRTYPAWSAPSR